ncbi:MAG: (R,R)-butanediol dehydrogenase / meso-butanediol dehydrogenase / diacetyl reductase [Solirubrobacterales bacterium]|nr:(R,R)-butanediol dehydrogenase / meso-butanediol dehydrogenase / diacetyl reductase [Solirubrobacterales bacterium]
MRAAVFHGAGDVRIEAVAAPGDPGPGEVLIAPSMAAICGTDASEFSHGPHMIPLYTRHPGSGHVGPLVLGHEFVGRVEAVGDGVEGIAAGDRVVSGAGVSCGECAWCRAGRTNLCASYYTLGLSAPGGLAEQVISPASICVPVPDAVADVGAAMAQPLAVAIHALDRGGVGPGQTVAVLGIGGIGGFLIGAASTRELRRLIAVDVDPGKLALASALGADDAIDARNTDVAAAIKEATAGEGADVVIEASGVPANPRVAIHATRRGGQVVIVGLQADPPPVDIFDAALREVDLIATVAHICDANLPESLSVLARTELAGEVLGEVVPMARLVEDAIAPLAEGTAPGKMVVEVAA